MDNSRKGYMELKDLLHLGLKLRGALLRYSLLAERFGIRK